MAVGSVAASLGARATVRAARLHQRPRANPVWQRMAQHSTRSLRVRASSSTEPLAHSGNFRWRSRLGCHISTRAESFRPCALSRHALIADSLGAARFYTEQPARWLQVFRL